MKWLKDNLVQIFIVLVGAIITWGKLQANFITLAERVSAIEEDRAKRIDKNDKDMDYLKNGVATLLERTKHL